MLRVTEEAEEDARLLTFLEQRGVRPGNVFAVVERADHVGALTLRLVDRPAGSGQVTLGLPAAAMIRILEGRAKQGLFQRVPNRVRRANSPASERRRDAAQRAVEAS